VTPRGCQLWRLVLRVAPRAVLGDALRASALCRCGCAFRGCLGDRNLLGPISHSGRYACFWRVPRSRLARRVVCASERLAVSGQECSVAETPWVLFIHSLAVFFLSVSCLFPPCSTSEGHFRGVFDRRSVLEHLVSLFSCLYCIRGEWVAAAHRFWGRTPLHARGLSLGYLSRWRFTCGVSFGFLLEPSFGRAVFCLLRVSSRTGVRF